MARTRGISFSKSGTESKKYSIAYVREPINDMDLFVDKRVNQSNLIKRTANKLDFKVCKQFGGTYDDFPCDKMLVQARLLQSFLVKNHHLIDKFIIVDEKVLPREKGHRDLYFYSVLKFYGVEVLILNQ